MWKKAAIGYATLALSAVPWLAMILLPIFDLGAAELAATTMILILTGEALFAFSLVLLGKEAWGKIKSAVMTKIGYVKAK